MRIAVMGTGGVGGYFGARLAGGGQDVSFIARGRQLDALRRNGLRVQSPLGDVHLPEVVATVAVSCPRAHLPAPSLRRPAERR